MISIATIQRSFLPSVKNGYKPKIKLRPVTTFLNVRDLTQHIYEGYLDVELDSPAGQLVVPVTFKATDPIIDWDGIKQFYAGAPVTEG